MKPMAGWRLPRQWQIAALVAAAATGCCTSSASDHGKLSPPRDIPVPSNAEPHAIVAGIAAGTRPTLRVCHRALCQQNGAGWIVDRGSVTWAVSLDPANAANAEATGKSEISDIAPNDDALSSSSLIDESDPFGIVVDARRHPDLHAALWGKSDVAVLDSRSRHA